MWQAEPPKAGDLVWFAPKGPSHLVIGARVDAVILGGGDRPPAYRVRLDGPYKGLARGAVIDASARDLEPRTQGDRW